MLGSGGKGGRGSRKQVRTSGAENGMWAQAGAGAAGQGGGAGPSTVHTCSAGLQGAAPAQRWPLRPRGAQGVVNPAERATAVVTRRQVAVPVAGWTPGGPCSSRGVGPSHQETRNANAKSAGRMGVHDAFSCKSEPTSNSWVWPEWLSGRCGQNPLSGTWRCTPAVDRFCSRWRTSDSAVPSVFRSRVLKSGAL